SLRQLATGARLGMGPASGPLPTLLAGEAFLVVGLATGAELVLGRIGGVVRFDAAREPRTLHALGAQVVERLDALLPRLEVQHHQVPLVDVGRNEQVEALRLVDERRA